MGGGHEFGFFPIFEKKNLCTFSFCLGTKSGVCLTLYHLTYFHKTNRLSGGASAHWIWLWHHFCTTTEETPTTYSQTLNG